VTVSASDRWDIRGRTALVTGAARGIGAETARELHARGMNVVLAGLEPERLQALAAELAPQALAVECNVTSAAELADAVRAAVERFGAIDALIANAGVNAVGTLETSDPATWERVIEVNLLGVVRSVRAALPQVIARHGYVLPVASVAAVMPLALGANYTAAKHGVHGFAQALRLELASHRVEVGCAYFGAIDTDMIRRSAEDPAIATMLGGMSGIVSRPVSASRAGKAIADGVAKRARMVYAPRRILPLLLAPRVFVPLAERAGRRATVEAVSIANARASAGQPGASTFVERT